MPLAGTTAPGRPSTPTSPARALGAPHTTCSGSPSPASTRQHLQLVGLRVRRGGQHRATRNGRQRLGRVLEPFDLEPDGVQLRGDLARRVGVGVEDASLSQVERELHARAPTPPHSVGTSRREKP